MSTGTGLLQRATSSQPGAIVLCRTVTGLATVRALYRAGISVQAWIFSDTDPTRFTRCARVVVVPSHARSEECLVDFLVESSRQLGDARPVVFPTCDAHALLLAQHSSRLTAFYRLWTTGHQTLHRIVSKDCLYAIADAAAVPTVPSIVEPEPAELASWSISHPGPYILKPFYVGSHGAGLHTKNAVVTSRDELLDYVSRNGAQKLIAQRLLRGGDGQIFDCYGLCDGRGRIVQMATHRRWRQNLPDRGATCFGEIPSGLPAADEATILEQTRLLLASVCYHGIFGIEWLRDLRTGRFHLIDFNARPFMCIGHLADSGLNLPALAYRELTGDLPRDLETLPRLRRCYWIDLLRDLQTFRKRWADGDLGFWEWLGSVVRCRSWAYLDFRDPLPGIVRGGALLRLLGRLAWTTLLRLPRSSGVVRSDFDTTR